MPFGEWYKWCDGALDEGNKNSSVSYLKPVGAPRFQAAFLPDRQGHPMKNFAGPGGFVYHSNSAPLPNH